MNRLRLTKEGRPPEIPEWVPITSAELSLDFLVREWSRIAFDNEQPVQIRMAAMQSLSKHAGMYIERVEVKNVDAMRAGALGVMFDSMTLEEKREWMRQQAVQSPTEIAVSNLTPHAEPVNALVTPTSRRIEAPPATKLAPPTTQATTPDATTPQPSQAATTPQPDQPKKRVTKREAFVNALPEFLKR
jgi:hypothetical protein